MKRLLLITLVAVALAVVGYCAHVLIGSDDAEAKQVALDRARAACFAALEKRAGELESWYLEDKKNTQNMAEELNGMKGKRVMAKTAISRNENERKAFFSEVSKRHLHTQEECNKQTALVVAELLCDWADVENQLAVELQRPDISHASQKAVVQGNAPHSGDLSSLLQKQIVADIATMVGSEVAASCVTALGASAGILGAGAVFSAQSFGISLVVGVVAEFGVNWYMDTEGKLKRSLDAQVEKTATEQKTKFREVMQKALENQVQQWEKQL